MEHLKGKNLKRLQKAHKNVFRMVGPETLPKQRVGTRIRTGIPKGLGVTSVKSQDTELGTLPVPKGCPLVPPLLR